MTLWYQNAWKIAHWKYKIVPHPYMIGHTLYTTNTSSSCSESVLTNIFGGVRGEGTSPSSVGPVINLERKRNSMSHTD